MQKREMNVTAGLGGSALQAVSGVTVAVTNDATSLPAALYSDNGVTLITAPIVTDTLGFYSYYAADGKYTETLTGLRLTAPVLRQIILEDPADNPVATLGQLNAVGGGALVKTASLGAGAVARSLQEKTRDTISVKDFGAVGDNVADDTAAIQLAINRIKAIGGGVLIFPCGTYKISARLFISGNFGFSGIEVRGVRATINSTHNGEAFYVKPSGVDSADAASEYRQNTLIHGFTIQGPGKASLLSVGVRIHQGANVQVRDCTIQNFYKNLFGDGALICNFHNLLIQRGHYGMDFLRIAPGAGGHAPEFGPNDVHFHNCQVIDNIVAVRAKDFPNGVMSFHTCEIEGNNLLGNATDGVKVVEFYNAGKVLFNSSHLEENPGQFNLWFHGENSNCHLTMIGGEVIPGDASGNCVFLSNATGAANAANALICGTRISNNIGNQLFISTGFKVTVIGGIGGLISGDLEKLTYINNGRVAVGVNESPFAQIKAKGTVALGVAFDCDGLFRFVDAAGARLGYMGSNASNSYFLSDGTPLLLGTNGGNRITISRLGGATVEPVAAGTYSLGTAAFPWDNVFAKNVVLTPAATATPANNGEMTFQLTSNTALAIKVKGLDGIVRSATLTLA